MDLNDIEPLLAALAANPANALLRMAIVRRLLDIGQKSRALAIVFDLEPAQVVAADDRRLVADLLVESGLLDRAAPYLDGSPAPHSTPAATLSPTQIQPAPPPREAQATAAAANSPSVRHNLRVVAGTEAGAVDETPLPPAEHRIVFVDVGGLEEVKNEIRRRIIAPLQQKGLFAKFKRRAGGGVLLYGPPGCGKTLLARATAGECGLPFHAVAIPEILDPLSGISERRLTQLFENARKRAPAVLFFDEIDALASKRSGGVAMHTAQLVSHFLTLLDGAGDTNDGLLVLAATNIPWSIDSAFLRPGRFDRLLFVPPPDREARESIIRLQLDNRPVADGKVDIASIAHRTSGYSGADLAGLVERAADMAIDASIEADNEVAISQKMLLAATKDTRSSVTDWLSTARNYATYANESGRYDDIIAFLNRHGR